MTRADWINRFTTRARALGADHPRIIARAAADEEAELHGATMLAWRSPEDVAEEWVAIEMGED